MSISRENGGVLQEISALTSRAGAITQELRRFSRRADRHIGKTSLQAALAGTQQLVLSAHPQTHEGSMLVRFPRGWQSTFGKHLHSVYEEMFVLEGGKPVGLIHMHDLLKAGLA